MLNKNLVLENMSNLINLKNYPCVAALQSWHRNDFEIAIHRKFGLEYQRPSLRDQLITYLSKYDETKSEYFTFWAVFDDQESFSEDEFEKRLWNELSSLTSAEEKTADKDPRFSDNPEDKNFCFSLNGRAFFVVGLHPNSSRLSRRFPWPTLVFNVYEQFAQLAAQNRYQPMIELNRKRDLKFQGSVNPMAEKHNDDWEAIQFSGKTNSSKWKCPFHFRSKNKEAHA